MVEAEQGHKTATTAKFCVRSHSYSFPIFVFYIPNIRDHMFIAIVNQFLLYFSSLSSLFALWDWKTLQVRNPYYGSIRQPSIFPAVCLKYCNVMIRNTLWVGIGVVIRDKTGGH